MTFSEGWHDQYQRMLRSHQRLLEAAGPSSMGSAEARDRLYHFFQDAYHLKDWLKNDPTTRAQVTAHPKVEGLFNTPGQSVLCLQLCADLCNGVKHLGLTRDAKTGDKTTGFTRQDAYVTLGTIEIKAYVGGAPARSEPQPAHAGATGEHRWFVTSNGQTYDAVDLANEVVVEWEKWLTAQQLLP
ncbi:hypothetical protein ABT061_15880 [Streptosporangium sp. NPDC002544]|uniref:hypothetical protein n=1 Tax=Streptosporangium sp. NPDC002544 TaxID=3154538 RepID=UPI00332C9E10